MEKIEKILKDVLDEIISDNVVVGISNRHIHLSKEELDILFGKDYILNNIKNMKQKGQFAAKETVTIKGSKGEIKNVRVLGPVRKETQVEISISDTFKLGINPPIRESGNLENTPGITIIGPKGEIFLNKGVIIALRHIHMPEYIAKIRGFQDGEFVSVKTSGKRELIFSNVLMRVSDNSVKEFHLDVDEANGAGLKNDDFVEIIKN